MDWNWFFSTLSQSAAATTGIFGAFIISKIFSNQAIFMEKKSRLKMLLAQAKKISTDTDDCDIDWYSKTTNTNELRKLFGELLQRVKITDAEKITDELIENLKALGNFSIFTPPDEIKQSIDGILHLVILHNQEEKKEAALQREAEEKEAIRRKEEQKKRQERYSSMPFSIDKVMAQIYDQNEKLRPEAVHVSTPHIELDSIIPHDARLDLVFNKATQLYSDAKHHAAITSDFLDSIKGNPESPRLISYSLLLVIMIFILGVIYPLSFMPMTLNNSPELSYSIESMVNIIFSFKGFLLTSISAFFIMVISIFAHANSVMKYSESDIKNIEKYTNAKMYSDHFINLD